MDVEGKGEAIVTILQKMNERLKNMPTKTDFESFIGKVNNLGGTMNLYIAAAKVDSDSIHREIKVLRDRASTIEKKKGSAAAPRRPTGQAASRYDHDPADIVKCDEDLKLVFSGNVEKNQTLAVVSNSFRNRSMKAGISKLV